MAESTALDIVAIGEHAAQLTEPFTMVDLAQIDDMALSLYLCQGTMPYHRHLDQDELFLVHSGTISLESDWGTAILRPGELAVAPKAVSHRSSSLLKSLVLLFQPRVLINRRNGDRRLFALKDLGRLDKVSVPAVGRQIAVPYAPVTLAQVDTYDLVLARCSGSGPWQPAGERSSLVLCYEGRMTLETEDDNLALGKGEIVVVPRDVTYRLASDEGSLALSMARRAQPGLPLPG